MTIDAHRVTATLLPTGTSLDVRSMDHFTLDEGWSPYAQVQIVCAVPTGFDRDVLDLRAGPRRIVGALQQDFGKTWTVATLTTAGLGSVAAMTALLSGHPLGYLTNLYFVPWNGSVVRPSRRRPFDLKVTDRTFNDTDKTVTITAQSDEAILNGDALIDTVPWTPATLSIRDICELVLARYGAILTPGDDDATVDQPDSAVWKPGVTASAYLTPLLEPASLRLWSDERGNWRLTQRQSTVEGAVVISDTDTMVDHRDQMGYNPDVWYDAVVVHYSWTDSFGLNLERYDAAGAQPSESVLVVERQAVYPGPGAAAGILNRGQGRGRVLDVRAVSNYDVSPGIAATIFPPDSESQTGYVSAVTFALPAAEMDVTTRGLVDTPETSWLYVPSGVEWLDILPGVSWLDYEPIGV